MQRTQLASEPAPPDDTRGRWKTPLLVALRLVVVVFLLALLSVVTAARPLAGLIVAVVFAVLIVLVHLPTAEFSWAGVGRNLRRTGHTLGLCLPVSRGGGRARLPGLVGWLLVAPAAVAFLLWWYGLWVVAVLPAPSGGEVAASAHRAQVGTAHGVLGALNVALLSAALPEELVFRSWILVGRRFLAVDRRGVNGLILPALIAASVIPFAFAHQTYGEVNIVSALGGGLLFALLAVGSRSLWPAVLAHGFLDAAILIAALPH